MYNVLILDSNMANLILYRHLLKEIKGLKFTCFDKTEDAFEWCHANWPDIILLDNAMPSMDGLTFIAKLKAIFHPHIIPFIMVTTEKDVRQQALELGAYDFISKPVDKSELLVRVRNLLALHESERIISDRAAWLATEVEKATQEIREREKEMILRLSRAAEHRDPETGYHLVRMANYSHLIARELGLCENEQMLILEAAPMHDIGKIAIPDAILLKPGKLNDDEFAVMKEHALNGYTILANSHSSLISMAATMALTHHEKFDGTGYPHGLKGEDIPLHGRIVAVGDVFDALTSPRPYKAAWTIEDAAQFLIAHSGSHFDPNCVTAFFKAWDDVLDIHTRYCDEIIDDFTSIPH
ncbi:MAG TPA: two-component system response regulator [Methylococcaceae bacterium]|nr:two-component system response regulator [Methylococcaceae bacterium]